MNDLSRYTDEVPEYRIKLMSDVEKERYASIIFNNKTANTSDSAYTLESGYFGVSKHTQCSVCGQTNKCTGHFGLIALPYPIITNTIIAERFFRLIQIICPCCSSFPIENAKDALNLQPNDRFTFIRSEVQKKQKNVINVCPYCKNQFIFITVEGDIPDYKFILKQEVANKSVQLNPLFVYSLLQNMSNQMCEYAGFNIETNDPRNYMTKYIPIIPNKLRIKTIDLHSSATTAAYRGIIDTVLDPLNKIYQTSIKSTQIIPTTEAGEAFNTLYAKLVGYYVMIIDMTRDSVTNACLEVLSKRDKQHLEPAASLIGRLKGKESSYFGKGIIATRHKVSGRTVLGSDTSLQSYELGFPEKYCNKMGTFVPVYAENLELMKQFVASMSSIPKHDYSKIRANKIYFSQSGSRVAVEPTKALQYAARLQPGDKIYMSLLPGTIVHHCRFPSVREESWASHMIAVTRQPCMTIPLAVCEYKNADFDGDETGIYADYSHVTDVECLLLNSIFKQLINHKFGNVGILFQGYDTKNEIKKIRPNVLIGVRDIRNSSGTVIARESFYPPKPMGEYIDSFFDYITGHEPNSRFSKIDKINYSDKSTIISNNKLDSEKCNLNNHDLFKYLILTIGPDRTLELIDDIIQLGYNFSYYKAISLGNEIRFYNPEVEAKINKIRADDYARMKAIEESDKSQFNKDLEKYMIYEEQKGPIHKLLQENIKGTNVEYTGMLKNMGCCRNMLVGMDSAIVDEVLPHPKLNNNTRTCSAFSQHSIDPMAYGYAAHGYLSNQMKPSETFFDCMMQRHALYIKGNCVADQGYLQKRFTVAFGQNVTDTNGAQVFIDKFVSPCYGSCALNPRAVFTQPLPDISMPHDEFATKYVSDVALIELHKSINEVARIYDITTEFIEYRPYEDKFVAGYDFEQYISHLNRGKSVLKDVNEFCDSIVRVFSPPGMKQRYNLLNLDQTLYYFRQRAQEYNITRKDFIKLYYFFINSLVDGGEPIGIKATLSVGEALTQESLDAIHHASEGSIEKDHLKRTSKGGRFEELVGGAIHRNAVITLGFYDSSEESVKAFARREETVYFPEIWTKLETNIRTDINPAVKQLHPTIADKFDKLEVAKTYVKMIWNIGVLADYGIALSDVYNKLYENFEGIAFITGTPVNAKEYLVYMYFNKSVNNEQLNDYIQQFKGYGRESIVHGDCVKNCFVTQNKCTGEWILRCNETNPRIRAYEKIIYRPEVDPGKCYTTNTRLMMDMYGVFETGARLCEELYYAGVVLSCVGDVPPRHFKTIGLGCVCNGEFFAAVSNSAMKSNIDYLRGCSFEQPTAFIKKAITEGTFKPIEDTVAAAFYGTLPKSGSGYSRVVLFKNQAPDTK